MALMIETVANETNAVADGTATSTGRKGKASKGKASTKSATVSSESLPKAAAPGKVRSGVKATAQPETKASIVLKKLNSSKGVTIEMLMEATGWQAHSVRGFLSAVVKKKHGLALINEIGKDGLRRYRVAAANAK
jgi:hypothetical protein